MGVEQLRTSPKGTVVHVTMPGNGGFEQRGRTEDEEAAMTVEGWDLLGVEVVDVYLNDRVYWRGVPQAVWDFTIGGFQVLRKWLSYREERVLGRPLTLDEA